jgi:phosphohistidine phosphatase
MRLFIVRHGEAEPLRHTDAERALTSKGMADACALGRFLADEQLHWDAIIVSPYLRARQTLDNILLSFPEHPAIQVNDTITPENAVVEAYNALATLGDAKNVLLVSHMPLVSSLVASLVEGSQHAAHSYPMNTASLAEVEVDDLCQGGGSLQRLISPPYNA